MTGDLLVGAPRTRRPRRLLAALGALVACGLVAGGAVWATGRHPPRTPAPKAGADQRTAARVHRRPGPAAPHLGVYVGPGNLAAATAVDLRLGDRVVDALDFVPEASWSTIRDPAWLVDAWRGGPFRLVIGVPMLPSTGATLAEGATGAYDPQFAALAARLVVAGLGHVVLMIGWQPDDTGEPWYVSSAAAARDYVTYWDDIATTMASVAGAHFTFEWDPGDGLASPVSPAAMYPGDAAVDVVATDAFDTVPAGVVATTRWRYVLERRDGPAWTAAFAAAHHKPLAVAMWGLAPQGTHGAGDDPAFVRGFLSWARASHVVLSVLWDYSTWALTAGGYPASLAVLEKAAG